MSEPLFQNSPVIRLTDRDFKINWFNKDQPNESARIKLINPQFYGKDGYIMAYASWCPHCQAKEPFWNYLAQQFNTSAQFKNENFRIAIIDGEDDENSGQILRALKVGPIPNFQHVFSDPQNPGEADLEDYDGPMTLEGFVTEACNLSPAQSLCKIDKRGLNAPQITN
jgi:thiol-disulfide isomerase/thioredoxin